MNNEQRTETQGATATENTQRVVDIPNYVCAKQKFDSLTPEIETRIKEELLVFANLGIAKDLMTLRDVMDKVKEQLGYSAEPSKGILAGSYVAYCLGLEPSNPMVTGKEIEPKDFQVTLPLGLTICYDNEVRNEVVN